MFNNLQFLVDVLLNRKPVGEGKCCNKQCGNQNNETSLHVNWILEYRIFHSPDYIRVNTLWLPSGENFYSIFDK
ncbi:MAG: hypothetical protein DWQ02_02250 [Bacteroidetes bacterium]|nr:MAG: hypothetical protein DWQ02_02250 [Bacteroidota bacterium]